MSNTFIQDAIVGDQLVRTEPTDKIAVGTRELAKSLLGDRHVQHPDGVYTVTAVTPLSDVDPIARMMASAIGLNCLYDLISNDGHVIKSTPLADNTFTAHVDVAAKSGARFKAGQVFTDFDYAPGDGKYQYTVTGVTETVNDYFRYECRELDGDYTFTRGVELMDSDPSVFVQVAPGDIA